MSKPKAPKVEHKTLFEKEVSLTNLKSDQGSLDNFVLRPGDECYVDPRSDAVRNQPILINSGEDEFVDDPEIPQKGSDNPQEAGPVVDTGGQLNKDVETDPGEGCSTTRNKEKGTTKARTRSLTPEKTKNEKSLRS